MAVHEREGATVIVAVAGNVPPSAGKVGVVQPVNAKSASGDLILVVVHENNFLDDAGAAPACELAHFPPGCNIVLRG